MGIEVPPQLLCYIQPRGCIEAVADQSMRGWALHLAPEETHSSSEASWDT
jgi:hypothetical protein